MHSPDLIGPGAVRDRGARTDGAARDVRRRSAPAAVPGVASRPPADGRTPDSLAGNMTGFGPHASVREADAALALSIGAAILALASIGLGFALAIFVGAAG